MEPRQVRLLDDRDRERDRDPARAEPAVERHRLTPGADPSIAGATGSIRITVWFRAAHASSRRDTPRSAGASKNAPNSRNAIPWSTSPACSIGCPAFIPLG